MFLLETAFDATSLASEPEDENNDPDMEGVEDEEDAHSTEEDQQGKNNNLFRKIKFYHTLSELTSLPESEWVWQPSDIDVEAGVMTVEYDVVTDKYKHGDVTKDGFESGCWNSINMARKVETEGKMVYVARMGGNNGPGEVEWRFQMPDDVFIDRVVLDIDSSCFHSGDIRQEQIHFDFLSPTFYFP